MKEKFLKIKWNGEVSVVELEPHWRSFCAEIGCDGIEMPGAYGINKYTNEFYLLVVDHIGRFRDSVYSNLAAGFLYGDVLNGIVGDCLVGKEGLRDGEHDIVGLEDDDITFLRSTIYKAFSWIEGKNQCD